MTQEADNNVAVTTVVIAHSHAVPISTGLRQQASASTGQGMAIWHSSSPRNNNNTSITSIASEIASNPNGSSSVINAINTTTSTTTTDHRPEPRMTIPLMVAFLLQLAIVVAAFVAVTTFLLIANLHVTDEGVISTLRAQLRAGHELFVSPMQEHGRTARQLALTLTALNSTMQRPTTMEAAMAINVTSDVVTAWKVMRVASNTSSQAAYAYGLSCVNFTLSTGDCAVWLEVGCNDAVCYMTRNFNSTYVEVDPSDPAGPIAMESAVTENYASSLTGEYYVTFVRNITTLFAWSSPYFWGSNASSVWGGPTLFMTGYYCTAFHPTLGGCMNAFALDINITYARFFLEQLVTEDGATASVVDLDTGALLIVAGSGIQGPVLNHDGALWSAREAPVKGVPEGLAAYEACARSQPLSASKCSMVILKQFQSVVVAIEPVTAILQVDDAPSSSTLPRFLLIKAVPRGYYYHDSDDNFRVSLGTIIGVCIAAVLASIGIFYGIAAPVKQLAVNFQHASALENEKVESAHSVFSEMNALNCAFLLLNQRLTTARAFLPLSILLNGGQQPTLPADTETAVLVRKLSTQRAMVLNSDDTDEEAEPCNPLSLDHDAMGPVVRSRRQQTAVAVRGMGDNVLPSSQEPAPPHGVLGGSTADNPSSAPMPRQPSGSLSDVLHNRNVAVVFANIVAFDAALQAAPQHAMRIHAGVLQQLIESVQRCGGVVDSFHGDQFLIAFNASSACPAPASRAVEAMVQTLEDIDNRPELVQAHKTSSKGNISSARYWAGLRLGIASGQAICGNLGNKRIQRFSVVGRCVSDAFALMQLARFEGLTNVVSDSVVRAVTAAASRTDQSPRIGTFAASNAIKPPPPPLVPATTIGSTNEAVRSGIVFFHIYHGVLPKAKEPTTISTILGRLQSTQKDGGGHDAATFPSLVGYHPLPLRPAAPADRKGPIPSRTTDGGKEPPPCAFAPAPSLQTVDANNEAFRLFAAGKFTRCRQLAHHIPAPNDVYIQKTLRVAYMSSAVHEW